MTTAQIECLGRGLSTPSAPAAPVTIDRSATYRGTVVIELDADNAFCWHACAWVADATGEPVPLARMSDHQRVELRRTVYLALEGAGDGVGVYSADRALVRLVRPIHKTEVLLLGKKK